MGCDVDIFHRSSEWEQFPNPGQVSKYPLLLSFFSRWRYPQHHPYKGYLSRRCLVATFAPGILVTRRYFAHDQKVKSKVIEFMSSEGVALDGELDV